MPEYTCSICGKKHNDLEKYAQCVANCAKEQHNKQKEENRKRIAARRDDRRKEIDACYKRLQSLLNEEYEDVGYSSSALGNILRPEIFFL